MRFPILAILTLILVLAGCATPESTRPPLLAGGATRDAVIDAYLLGLEHRNASVLSALVSPEVDAHQDVAAVLARYGGLRLTGRSIRTLDEFGGIFVRTWVSGTAQDGSRQEVEIPISRVGGRYFLALGQAGASGLEASPER
jgi:hypothetical protein